MEDNKNGGLSWSQPKGGDPTQSQQKQASWQKVPTAKEAGVVASKNRGAPDTSNKSTLVVVFIVGLAVGLLALWGWFAFSGGDSIPAEDATGKTISDSVSVVAGELAIPPLQDAGLTVSVTAAIVASPTWIVVYESRNGVPGNALGAALFTPERTTGSVNLLRGTISGQTYFVGQQRDNGDRVFSLENDAVALDEGGNPILVQFQTR